MNNPEEGEARKGRLTTKEIEQEILRIEKAIAEGTERVYSWDEVKDELRRERKERKEKDGEK